MEEDQVQSCRDNVTNEKLKKLVTNILRFIIYPGLEKGFYENTDFV